VIEGAMTELRPLNPRAAEILGSIVQAYIQTGRPVASRSVSRLRKDRLSPASIRNVMADLAEEGYLSQPHTSAGRVPTEKAFRLFVRSLSACRLLESELDQLRRELGQAGTVAARVERSSHILVEKTHGLGIAAAIPTAGQTLDQIELLALADRRVLMIVVTRDRMVHNRVVTLDEPVSQDELNSIRNYINANFSGCVLSDVRARLQLRLEQASAAYDAILRKLILLYDKGLLDMGLVPEVHMEGAANLVGIELHLTREKLRDLFLALEEKKRVLQLLDRFLEGSAGEVSVHVGLGEAHPGMKELSLIGVSVALAGGLNAKIAVIGPMRMNYQKAMSAVLHVGQAFQSVNA
jgi:heat-inducible transcriptional repressor